MRPDLSLQSICKFIFGNVERIVHLNAHPKLG